MNSGVSFIVMYFRFGHLFRYFMKTLPFFIAIGHMFRYFTNLVWKLAHFPKVTERMSDSIYKYAI